MGKFLLTSFRPWLSHHKSNASDDLLVMVEIRLKDNENFVFLRKLPVDTSIASGEVIKAIADHQSEVIICCGMAESYSHLTIESQAYFQGKTYQTSVDLEQLTGQLKDTKISDDAGKFVCEGLYFHVLEHLAKNQPKAQAIFVHVPLLTEKNKSTILADFLGIIDYFLARNSS